jgi:hypothetical protein
MVAQNSTATLEGTVKDVSGASVPGAIVTAKNVDTGVTRTATSLADGTYHLSAIPAGNYELVVKSPGFKQLVRSGITLTVTEEAVVDLSLENGSVDQQVDVFAPVPMVDTSSSSLGGVVSEKQMADLPLNGRNYMQLALIQPGVTELKQKPSNSNYSMGGGAGSMFSSNGAPLRSNNYLLDGTMLVSYGGATNSSVSGDTLGLDGIREFKIITNNFPAQYGMTMGSQMVMVSKSGTNDIHGDIFEYLRNSAMDARNYFDTPASSGTHPDGSPRRLPEFQRNNFGGSVGGAIRKDKTFYFVTYEGLRQRQGTSNINGTLGSGCRGPAGSVITNTACSQLGTTTSVTVAATVAPWLSLFPEPNYGTNQIAFSYPSVTSEDYAEGRIDQTFSARDTLFGRYTYDKANQSLVNFYPGYPSFPSSTMMFLTIGENHIISPTLLNNATFSYARSGQYLGNNTAQYVTGPDYSFATGFPMGTLNVSGVTTAGAMLAGGNPTSRSLLETFGLADDVFKTMGRHSIQFGTLINHIVQYTANGTNTFGAISFSNVASFLKGTPSSLSAFAPPFNNVKDIRYETFGFYGQDDWKVSRTLTLNLGLRYEFNTNARDINGDSNALRNIYVDSNLTPGPYTINTSFLNFGPRLGFSWDVTGDGKTAVRGGIALLYNVAGYYSTVHQVKIAPQENYITVTSPSSFTVPFTLPTNNLQARTGTTYDYDMKQAKLLQYTLSVQRQLPFKTAVTVAYGGSEGFNLMALPFVNPVIPQGIPGTTATGAETCVAPPAGYVPLPLGQQQYTYGSANTCWLGTYLSNPSPATLPTEVRRNPYWNDFGWVSNTAFSWYNSLQTTLEKRVGNGLQMQANFTWSKLLDTNQGQSNQDTSVSYSAATVDALHINRERAPAAFNIPFSFHFNAVYNFPTMGGRGFVPGLLNGWWISGIVQLQSGYPFTPAFSTSRSKEYVSGNASGIDRPNVIPGRNNSNITRGTTAGCLGVASGQKLNTSTLYFDPCAFTIQPSGFLGDESLNALIGPNFKDVDFSVVKDTRVRWLGKQGSLELRAEIFNIFNRANFNQPSRIIFAGTGPATNDVESVLSGAGTLTSAFPSRQIQLAAKILF